MHRACTFPPVSLSSLGKTEQLTALYMWHRFSLQAAWEAWKDLSMCGGLVGLSHWEFAGKCRPLRHKITFSRGGTGGKWSQKCQVASLAEKSEPDPCVLMHHLTDVDCGVPVSVIYRNKEIDEAEGNHGTVGPWEVKPWPGQQSYLPWDSAIVLVALIKLLEGKFSLKE